MSPPPGMSHSVALPEGSKISHAVRIDAPSIRRAATEFKYQATCLAEQLGALKSGLDEVSQMAGRDGPGSTFMETYLPRSQSMQTYAQQLVERLISVAESLDAMATSAQAADASAQIQQNP